MSLSCTASSYTKIFLFSSFFFYSHLHTNFLLHLFRFVFPSFVFTFFVIIIHFFIQDFNAFFFNFDGEFKSKNLMKKLSICRDPAAFARAVRTRLNVRTYIHCTCVTQQTGLKSTAKSKRNPNRLFTSKKKSEEISTAPIAFLHKKLPKWAT